VLAKALTTIEVGDPTVRGISPAKAPEELLVVVAITVPLPEMVMAAFEGKLVPTRVM
jgi:hypothetical protein